MDLKRGHTRIWHLFFAVGIMTLMWSCKPEYPEPTDRREQLNHINICVLGNSYSNDAYSYLPFILLDYGITSNIHIIIGAVVHCMIWTSNGMTGEITE